VLFASLAASLSGCIVFPKPLDTAERERLAAESQRALFERQDPLNGPLTLPEAVARAIKYQADYRQRQMEEAAAVAQVDVAKFDLLPRFTVSAGYTTRDNEAFSFGVTPGGQITTSPSTATERNRYLSTVGFAWNLLDFGVSYFRARQLADQSLIMQERRRKAVQMLMHDVRIAWWRAEAAQRLLPEADRLLAEVDRAVEKTRVIEARKLLPPLQTATLRRAMHDLGKQPAGRLARCSARGARPDGRLREARGARPARAARDAGGRLSRPHLARRSAQGVGGAPSRPQLRRRTQLRQQQVFVEQHLDFGRAERLIEPCEGVLAAGARSLGGSAEAG